VTTSRRFRIRYGALRPLLSIMGLGPSMSTLELDGDQLRVRMGWAFRSSIPLASITGARPDSRLVGGIGVHGWRGRWLVNGAASGIVAIDIDPPARAAVLGVPVRPRSLRVSVDEPEAFMAALRSAGPGIPSGPRLS
jgi:hypothetical protein